jgi:hypothetical protein
VSACHYCEAAGRRMPGRAGLPWRCPVCGMALGVDGNPVKPAPPLDAEKLRDELARAQHLHRQALRDLEKAREEVESLKARLAEVAKPLTTCT